MLYTGNEGNQDVTTLTPSGASLGFTPDFVWGKNRGSTVNHYLANSVVGSTNVMYSNATTEEETSATWDGIITNGFRFSGGSGVFNNDSSSYVAWNWKANGSGSANTAGTINTTSTSANVDAGFSIVSYTGNSTGSATFGHGLNKAPELVIIKPRNVADNWVVWYKNSVRMLLHDTRADIGNNPISTSSTLITTPSNVDNSWNGSYNYIAYCFHSVDGYSKVGSYTGNGNADGTFIYTGFRPAFILHKVYSTTGQWLIWDTSRDTYNVINNGELLANSNVTEGNGGWGNQIDIVSNGFKFRGSDNTNFNHTDFTHIYYAVAETPFKYSNAR